MEQRVNQRVCYLLFRSVQTVFWAMHKPLIIRLQPRTIE